MSSLTRDGESHPGSSSGRRSLEDLGGWLEGRWTVDRTINGDAGHFLGDAVFIADGGSVIWRERGRLTLDGFEGPAGRELRLAPTDGGAWQVSFDDGRPFHRLDLRDGHFSAEHLCGPDVYRGRFEARDDERLAVSWQVTGPGRADLIVSDYRRAV